MLRNAGTGQTITIAIGSQDTTNNTAAAGVVVRQLHLLERHLPHTGEFAGLTYNIQWQNFYVWPAHHERNDARPRETEISNTLDFIAPRANLMGLIKEEIMKAMGSELNAGAMKGISVSPGGRNLSEVV